MALIGCNNKTEHQTIEVNADKTQIEKAEQAADYNNAIVKKFDGFQKVLSELNLTFKNFDTIAIVEIATKYFNYVESSLDFCESISPFYNDNSFSLAAINFFKKMELTYFNNLKEIVLAVKKFDSYNDLLNDKKVAVKFAAFDKDFENALVEFKNAQKLFGKKYLIVLE
jgi:hypothetical protein